MRTQQPVSGAQLRERPREVIHFRHTFSTWLEDAGTPARVIDELTGHQRSRHGALEGDSRIGVRYRHTTEAMAVRVVDAIQERLTTALRVAEDAQANRHGTKRVF